MRFSRMVQLGVLVVLLGLGIAAVGCGDEQAGSGDTCSCPPGYLCKDDGECGIPCVSNLECPPGEYCSPSGWCETSSNTDGDQNVAECKSDEDCPWGFVCRNQQCVREEVELDGDSDLGSELEVQDTEPNPDSVSEQELDLPQPDGDQEPSIDREVEDSYEEAQTGCKDDSECPSGFYCDESSGMCIPSSSDGDEDRQDVDEQEWEPPSYNCSSDVPPDPNNPTIVGSYNSNNPLDFGAVPVLGSATREIELMNAGAQTLVIMDIYFEVYSPEFNIDAPNLPVSLDTNETYTVRITYTALDREPDTTAVIVYSNDPTTPCYRIPIITSIKSSPVIGVFPAELEFGAVRRGDSQTRNIHIENIGLATLGIYRIELTGESSPAFSLESVPNSFPIALAVGDGLDFTVRFAPQDLNEHNGWVTILSDDEQHRTVVVHLHGKGAEPDIDVVPLVVDFSGVPTGDSAQREVIVRNVGDLTLNVSEISLDPSTTSDYSVTPALPVSMQLEPAEEFVLSVTYSPDGAGTDEGAINIYSDDPDEPHVIVRFSGEAVPPDIDVLPLAVDFGRVPIGTMVSETITIRNLGNAVLEILDYRLEDGAGDIFLASALADTSIPPLAEQTLEVRFAPTRTGAHSDALIIESNDPDEPTVRVSITGEGINPADIEVSPLEIDFGEVPVGERRTATFTVSNVGDVALNLTGFTFVSGVGVFAIETSPLPSVLGPGESASVEVSFLPDAVATYEDWIQISSDDPDEPVVQVHLIGSGISPQDINAFPNPLVFPDTVVGQSSQATLTVENLGAVDLHIASYGVRNGQHFRFSTQNPPMVIAGGTQIQLTLEFVPQSAGDHSDAFLIVSDDPDEPIFTVVLQGRGVAPQDIQVEPVPVDFGSIPYDSSATRTVRVSNVGGMPLVISSIGMDSSPYFRFQSGAPSGRTLGVGESFQFVLVYEPARNVGNHSTVLHISSDDPDEPLLNVPVIGSAYYDNQPPVADARCVNGCYNENGHSWDADPITTITLDGSNSYDPDGSIVSYQWDIVSAPSGSYVSLASPTSVSTTANVDLPGEYVFRLTVTDNDGATSADTAAARAVIYVRPHEKIHIQLSWDFNRIADVDLHLWGPDSTPPSSGEHCYYGNLTPNWGVHGHPSLDHDNLGCPSTNNTPENINLDDPCDGCEYTVMIQGYDSHEGDCYDQPNYHGVVQATLRVYLSNSSTPEYERTFTLSSWSHSWSSAAYIIPIKIRWHGTGWGEIIELQ